jgi:hypothetical protein
MAQTEHSDSLPCRAENCLSKLLTLNAVLITMRDSFSADTHWREFEMLSLANDLCEQVNDDLDELQPSIQGTPLEEALDEQRAILLTVRGMVSGSDKDRICKLIDEICAALEAVNLEGHALEIARAKQAEEIEP